MPDPSVAQKEAEEYAAVGTRHAIEALNRVISAIDEARSWAVTVLKRSDLIPVFDQARSDLRALLQEVRGG